jgi:hypothetical protein
MQHIQAGQVHFGAKRVRELGIIEAPIKEGQRPRFNQQELAL